MENAGSKEMTLLLSPETGPFCSMSPLFPFTPHTAQFQRAKQPRLATREGVRSNLAKLKNQKS